MSLAVDLADASAILRDLVRTTQFELRTLINQIIGYTELLQELASERGNDDLVVRLERIRTASRGLLAWLAAELDLAKLASRQAGSAPALSLAQVPVQAILDCCAELRDHLPEGCAPAAADIDRIEAAGLKLRDSLQSVAELSNFDVIGAAGVALPAERALALQAMSRAREAVQVGPAQVARTDKILVVDANDAQRDLLSRRLTRLGYQVAEVANGFDALAAVRAQGYDLVLLDIMLPEMDGTAVLEELKKDPLLAPIPVIMLSAVDQIEWVTQCIELGAEDYLPKPFEPMVLQARIEASLEKRRLRLMEIEYLREVGRVTDAALAVETGDFEPQSLDEVAGREDGLGNLARMFQRMAREVQAREAQLRQQVQELRIEIDTVKRNQEVSKILESDYFQRLRKQARLLRRR